MKLGSSMGGGGGLACRLGFVVLVCSRRRLVADCHSLPFPSLSLNEGPPKPLFWSAVDGRGGGGGARGGPIKVSSAKVNLW